MVGSLNLHHSEAQNLLCFFPVLWKKKKYIKKKLKQTFNVGILILRWKSDVRNQKKKGINLL